MYNNDYKKGENADEILGGVIVQPRDWEMSVIKIGSRACDPPEPSSGRFGPGSGYCRCYHVDEAYVSKH